MDIAYSPADVERETQEYWEKKQCFKVAEDLNKEKFYCLTMFPYPSGTLHMGHVRCYTIGDVISRYQRMLGKNVLQPIGWDAFGLPAENAAIKHGVAPSEWTYQNIDKMRAQFKRLGNAYDWKREIATCDPDYYRWEQWFFTKLYDKGLVYKKNALVNWDPVDNTVLANEQVIDGRGWRSGALVERKEISQWFLKITHYADELLDDLQTLEEWPSQVKTMQTNWIGRSQGAEIFFKVDDSHHVLKVFTTRADTLMGSTYLAIACEHPLAKLAAQGNPSIAQFIDKCRTMKMAEAEIATIEKEGIDSGFFAIHPITGEKIPVWLANFVLMEYGTGAVMSVPGHDQRDFEFAQKYGLPIKQVIAPSNGEAINLEQGAYTEHGILVHSEKFDGLSSEQAKEQITLALEKDKLGKACINYRLRDWGVSRQRYWGTPIPMINCSQCGAVAVPEDDLPVVLPENIQISGHGSALKDNPDFYQTSCPKCGQDATRETDTFDTFVESSWYYARFACNNQDNAMLDDRAKYWTPVDQYVGGIEHAVMHLLYARFFHKLLRDEGLLNSDEPFTRLLTQGMVLKDGSKMSKSKGNTVDPSALIEKYGADTVRFFTIFAAPPEQSLEWSDSGVEGAHRFLRRLWSFAHRQDYLIDINASYANNCQTNIDWTDVDERIKSCRQEIHSILKQALYDFSRNQFNTVASAGMKILNLLTKIEREDADDAYQYFVHESLSIILRLLSPIIPHICQYLWRTLAYGKLIVEAPWPKVAKDALVLEEIQFVVQVNGKLRAHISAPAESNEQAIEALAKTNETIARHIQDKHVIKTIVIKNRKLVNLVVKP